MASPIPTAKVEVDSDHFQYIDDPAFPWPTRVDENGCRWFLQSSHTYAMPEDDFIVRPRFRLLPTAELSSILAAKSAEETVTSHGMEFSSFTIQSIKAANEDRVFVHPFEGGTLFGVFDGHCGSHVSEKACKELPLLLETALRDVICVDCSLAELTGAIERAVTDVILEFDNQLYHSLEDFVKEFEEEYAGYNWGPEHIRYSAWLEAKAANRPALAVEGSTALIGLIPASRDHVWVACVGDSEAHHGRFDGKDWVRTPLSEIHGTANPEEVERVTSEHPGEDVIVDDRVIGLLPLTRALGDYVLKSPMEEVLKYHRYMRPPVALVEWYDKSAPNYKTAPYLTAKPTFKDMALCPGDVLVFTTDGLRDIRDIADAFTETEKSDTFVSLAGAAASRSGNVAQWEQRLGHKFLDHAVVGNPAAWMVQNLLFGLDQLKLAREMTIEVPLFNRWQDDLTLLVVSV